MMPSPARNPACSPRLRHVLRPQIIALGLANLEPAALSKPNMAACNNACWSLGASYNLRIQLCSEPELRGCAASNGCRHISHRPMWDLLRLNLSCCTEHLGPGLSGSSQCKVVLLGFWLQTHSVCTDSLFCPQCQQSLRSRVQARLRFSSIFSNLHLNSDPDSDRQPSTLNTSRAGEVALQQPGDAMAPYATPILERLVPVLQSPRGAVPSSLVDNSAITLGRVRARSTVMTLIHSMFPDVTRCYCAYCELQLTGVRTLTAHSQSSRPDTGPRHAFRQLPYLRWPVHTVVHGWVLNLPAG